MHFVLHKLSENIYMDSGLLIVKISSLLLNTFFLSKSFFLQIQNQFIKLQNRLSGNLKLLIRKNKPKNLNSFHHNNTYILVYKIKLKNPHTQTIRIPFIFCAYFLCSVSLLSRSLCRPLSHFATYLKKKK